jgi:hypothetical protein
LYYTPTMSDEDPKDTALVSDTREEDVLPAGLIVAQAASDVLDPTLNKRAANEETSASNEVKNGGTTEYSYADTREDLSPAGLIVAQATRDNLDTTTRQRKERRISFLNTLFQSTNSTVGRKSGVKTVIIRLVVILRPDRPNSHFGINEQLLESWQLGKSSTERHPPVNTFYVWVLLSDLDQNTCHGQVHITIANLVHSTSYVLDGVCAQVLVINRL